MSFDELPDGWAHQPLTDESLVADVLDLLILDADRRGGGLGVLLCDRRGVMTQPCFVSLEGADPAEVDPVPVLDTFVLALTRQEPDGGALLVAIARRDGLSLTDSDRRVQRAAMAACRGGGSILLGVHVVTRYGSRRIPPLAALGAA